MDCQEYTPLIKGQNGSIFKIMYVSIVIDLEGKNWMRAEEREEAKEEWEKVKEEKRERRVKKIKNLQIYIERRSYFWYYHPQCVSFVHLSTQYYIIDFIRFLNSHQNGLARSQFYSGDWAFVDVPFPFFFLLLSFSSFFFLHFFFLPSFSVSILFYSLFFFLLFTSMLGVAWKFTVWCHSHSRHIICPFFLSKVV